jgi:phosphatidylglycerol:prolipoprotein diacylglycerol transferase
MSPKPFGFANAHLLLLVPAILVAVATLAPAARRAGLSLSRLVAIEILLSVAGLVGAVLYNLAEVDALERFGWRSLYRSGLRYPGGLIGIVAVLPVVSTLLPRRMTLAGFLDLLAPSAAIAIAILRVGCLLVGCCYGVPSDLPWALAYPPGSQVARHHAARSWVASGEWSLPVHPLHIYLGLASLAVGLFLLWFQRRKSYDGQVLLLYLALHEAAKGLLELLRGGPPGHSVAHLSIVSLSIAGLATALLVYARLRHRSTREATRVDRAERVAGLGG